MSLSQGAVTQQVADANSCKHDSDNGEHTLYFRLQSYAFGWKTVSLRINK